MAGETVTGECVCRLVTKTGQVRWVEIRGATIRHRGGVATLGNVQDITENHRMAMELRELSTRLFTIQEEERRRVARELHDSVGQKLTGIKFLVEAALGAPWPGERRSGMERLRSLVPTIQDAVEEVRRISTALRPSVLDDLGLLPTIVWYLREFAKVHPNISVEQALGAVESEIPPALRTPIFRILQEATNNAAKHSGASRLVVGLESHDGGLRLRVQDDGVGFDPGARREGAGAEGSGLSSMRERAEFSGGAFALVSNAGEGTTVEASWPLDTLVSA
jgi:signal transduction histidine kinase